MRTLQGMRRLLRVAILVVLFFWILGLVVAVSRAETGPVEDALLVGIIGGLFALSVPVHRIGAGAS